MKHSLRLIIFLFTLITIPGCKTRKITIDVRDQVQNSTKPPDQIIILDNDCEWFDGKFSADINVDGKANSVKGRARIRKDSLIWISVKAIDIIEAFRILISPDSVQMINYLDKKFFMDKFSAIKDFIKYDLSFQMVQNIFVGNPTFIFNLNDYKVFNNKTGDEIISSSDFKTYVDARNSSQPANFLFQALWVKDKVHTRNLIYDPANKVELDLQYTEHEMVDSLLFPKTTQLTVIGDSAKSQFKFTYNKIVLNEPFDFPFTIPDSYERIFLNK